MTLSAIILAGLVLATGIYFYFNLQGSQVTLNSTLANESSEIQPIEEEPIEKVAEGAQKTEFESLQELVSRELAFENQRRPHREEYGIPKEVFEDLPPVPDDFGTMAYMFGIGKWVDLTYFTEGYYKQPEFYSGFKEVALKLWKQPDPTSWGVIGWGAYPGDVWVETYPGAEFEATTFWHTGWGVQTHQGLQLIPVYPASSVDEAEKVFNTQDPVEVSKYFTVTFDNPIILLGPSYPKFSKNWATKAIVRVKVNNNAPNGAYVLGIDAGMPPEELRTEWLKQYKMMYFDAASGGLSLNRPHFRLIIKIDG